LRFAAARLGPELVEHRPRRLGLGFELLGGGLLDRALDLQQRSARLHAVALGDVDAGDDARDLRVQVGVLAV